MVHLTKPQDLAEYIKTKKPLYAELSKRELANKTKYSESTCLRALAILKDESFGPFGPKDQIIKKIKNQGNLFSQEGGTPPPPPNESWFEMEDPELSRHTYREILLNNKSTVRERLEAASKLVDLKYKSGTLDVKTQSEREVMDKFRQHDTRNLVDILKASSQKEHS